MCLLLGATGVGKTLLVKRLQTILPRRVGGMGPGAQVGTNLTDIVAQRRITIRELGGCMGPIWSSYYGNCHSLLFMVDTSNPTQLSASCVQLLALLSAEQLAEASVLILFNKIDLPCYMTIEEIKSLIRLPDLIACAKQNITTVEISAWKGTGLSEVLRWLEDTHRTNG
ncbi:ADP-ribosylation factor-like protein 16 isoform X2 [Lagenorhynchus albirostris]|uniref:ADP-ribosylation factor-like protein 16 isoform X2 n=1 Tax=Lagenorhynchus albirostris TaxID=27610 RepID=UPI0028E88418|nr:ADP-ribosylation factor-like protein 16 isoform X2 [Lagenorhynchus albirostris]XP_060146415.1 ADP-ribosylation factor-like protein 16 isoform X2 [Globicephala melas]